jgi:DNA-binding NarL/FixJ family response regulator
MVLIASANEELARRCGDAIAGDRRYALRLNGDNERAIWAALRHEAHSAQPGVVVLDVRTGGQRCRVLDALPGLLRTKSRPAVVVVLPRSSRRVEEEAAKMGAWDVVIATSESFEIDLANAVASALATWPERQVDPLYLPSVLLH